VLGVVGYGDVAVQRKNFEKGKTNVGRQKELTCEFWLRRTDSFEGETNWREKKTKHYGNRGRVWLLQIN
jgi:hypothetical protein